MSLRMDISLGVFLFLVACLAVFAFAKDQALPLQELYASRQLCGSFWTYEVPLLGWPLTLALCVPALFLPPIMGKLGQWTFNLFVRKSS